MASDALAAITIIDNTYSGLDANVWFADRFMSTYYVEVNSNSFKESCDFDEVCANDRVTDLASSQGDGVVRFALDDGLGWVEFPSGFKRRTLTGASPGVELRAACSHKICAGDYVRNSDGVEGTVLMFCDAAGDCDEDARQAVGAIESVKITPSEDPVEVSITALERIMDEPLGGVAAGDIMTHCSVGSKGSTGEIGEVFSYGLASSSSWGQDRKVWLIYPTAVGNELCQICGDGLWTAAPNGYSEACDDGNTVGGDGCSADCQTVESGYSCPSQGEACIPD